jgi:hypothetical protein
LDEVVGVRLVSVPAAHRALQERDLVLDLLAVFGRRRITALRLRPIGAGRFCGVYNRRIDSLGMCVHLSKFHTKTGKNAPISRRDAGFTQVNVGL